MALEFDDIQRGIFHPRPSPYAASYILFRIDDPGSGRQALQRLLPLLPTASEPLGEDDLSSPALALATTFQGLKALGVPQESLDSFPPEFAAGMAARAATLGDTGESAPQHWEAPLGTPDVHLVLSVVAPDQETLEDALARGRKAYEELAGVKAIWRQDCYALPTDREHFGYNDGMGQPAIEGSTIPGNNPREQPLKAGEFVLGYPDEMGNVLMPQPEALGRNGTFFVFRKLYQRVGAFRQFLKDNAASPEAEELLAAKMMGRWRSGAPLAHCPDCDDPAMGTDPVRHNDFLYRDDDPRGLKTPIESHIRRMNPRDGDVIGVPRLHRIIRRGTVYGPPLPEDASEDDGVDRGLMFACIGAHLDRQFEFVQSEWMNKGDFAGFGDSKDPIAGANDGKGTFTVPQRPIRRTLQGLPRFVVTRGGEYAFVPGFRALKWLAALES
jgi:Dyp-type peroxidase family